MKTCILDSTTKTVVNCINLTEQERLSWSPYTTDIELAPQHDGEIGWRWDVDAAQWIKSSIALPTLQEKAAKARQQRDKYLKMYVDIINAVRWQSLTDQQRTEAADYRQSLLDVPSQLDFPENIQWPVVPEWLVGN